MNPLFAKLPGISMPVPDVARQISAMWREEDQEHDLSNAHALQMNLIIHFGVDTSPKEGQQVFEVAIQFSQKYPCRIIVLCPENPTGEEIALDAKLYSQCFLSKDLRDQCCCEALILGYGTNEAPFLEDQISVWLASDLPIYHWLHGASVQILNMHCEGFLAKAKRVVWDSAIDSHGYEALTCLNGVVLSDLANARTARLRQSLGQFLAASSPRQLIAGLGKVTVSTQPKARAEAQRLLAWQKEKLSKCIHQIEAIDDEIIFQLIDLPDGEVNAIESKWTYGDGRTLSWSLPKESAVAWIKASSNEQIRKYPLRADPYIPEKALSEACFF
tara:strand:- start:1245 stop:2234 length:990 start_codon:yes stop_codon:yes gene_type:complete